MSFTHSNNTFISGLFHLTLCFFHKIKPRQNRHGNTYKLYTDIWAHLWRQRAQKVQLQPQKASWDDRTSCSTYASVLFCLFLATVPFPETHIHTHTHEATQAARYSCLTHMRARTHTRNRKYSGIWEQLGSFGRVCLFWVYICGCTNAGHPPHPLPLRVFVTRSSLFCPLSIFSILPSSILPSVSWQKMSHAFSWEAKTLSKYLIHTSPPQPFYQPLSHFSLLSLSPSVSLHLCFVPSLCRGALSSFQMFCLSVSLKVFSPSTSLCFSLSPTQLFSHSLVS